MKKILSNIYLLAALFMIGAAITSCSKSDDTPAPEPKPVGPTTYTMTIKATKAADAKTRALILSQDGKTLSAEWKAGEQVTVYNKTKEKALGNYLEAQGDGASTTLTGTLTGTIEAGDELTLKFCSDDYSSQNGTLEYIAANCDYATANVTVATSNNGKITTTTDADFENQQAIVKFTLLDKADGTTTLSPNDLTINYGSGSVKLTNIPATTYTTNGAGILYVAIPGFNHDVTLNAKMEDKFYSDTYSYTRGGATFENNKYYAITVKMVKNFNPYKTPLTLENCYDGTNRISVSNYYELEYSINGSAWASFDGEESLVKRGDKISFRGTRVTRNNYIDYNGSTLTTIASDYGCYVYGNIMSLIDPTSFVSLTSLNYDNEGDTDNKTFERLFYESKLSHKDGKDLVLPATTLTDDCYKWMFYGSGSLEQAPELPANKVPSGAYNAMFYKCSSLNYVKCLATKFSDDNTSTYEWLNFVAATGTFIKAKGASWTTDSDSGIPSGWNVIEE